MGKIESDHQIFQEVAAKPFLAGSDLAKLGRLPTREIRGCEFSHGAICLIARQIRGKRLVL
jgi:hypothetical protein